MVTVLVVEDEIMNYTIFERFFTSRGHTAQMANNGEVALEVLAKTESIDIIFTDFNMPLMNGYDFSKAVKTDERYARYRHVPIIGIGDFPYDKRGFLMDCASKESMDFSNFPKWIDKYCNTKHS